MTPLDIDPKETHARPVFKLLGVSLLLLMAVILLFESLPFLMQPGPVDVICSSQRRDLECEVGAMIVRALPAGLQRTVVGLGGLAAVVGVLAVAWALLRSGKR